MSQAWCLFDQHTEPNPESYMPNKLLDDDHRHHHHEYDHHQHDYHQHHPKTSTMMMIMLVTMTNINADDCSNDANNQRAYDEDDEYCANNNGLLRDKTVPTIHFSRLAQPKSSGFLLQEVYIFLNFLQTFFGNTALGPNCLRLYIISWLKLASKYLAGPTHA